MINFDDIAMPQFVIIALTSNTCPNLEYIFAQFVIAALFCNNGCPNLYSCPNF